MSAVSSDAPAAKTWNAPKPLGAEISARADEVEAALESLIEVSEIEDRFKGDSLIIGINPWQWGRLADEHIPLLSAARAKTERWLDEGARIIRINAPEFLADFENEAASLTRVVDRSCQATAPDRQTRPKFC